MEENIDLEKIMNMVNIVKKISSANEVDNTENENVTKAPLATIKSAIPYLEEKYRPNLNLMVKFIEIDKLIGNIQALSVNDKDNRKPVTILEAVRDDLDDKKQKLVDIIIRVIEIKGLMEGLKNA